MNQSDVQGWIRVVLLVLLLLFVLGYGANNTGTTATENPTPQTQDPQETTPETQPATEPACTIPTQEETTPQTEPPTIATEPPTEPPTEPASEWKSLGSFLLTAYCPCKKCCGKDPGAPGYGITSTGAKAEAGTTIAVDPRVIPYGSSVKINDHIYIAQDTGGAIKSNRIDIYYSSHDDALQFGVQTAEIFIQTEVA